MGCEKRVFQNNQIRFDTFLTTRVGIEVKKPGAVLGGGTVPAYAGCRRTGAGGESPPIAARKVGDCRRRGKNPPSCAGRQPWGAPFTPVEKLAKILTPPPLYDMARVGSECLHCMDRILSADLAIRTPAVAR